MAIIGIFALPVLVHSQVGEPIDVAVTVSPYWYEDNGVPGDSKVRMWVKVASGPTNTLSGATELFYNEKVIIDLNKPTKHDERTVAAIREAEAQKGRNVTVISWNDGKIVYP